MIPLARPSIAGGAPGGVARNFTSSSSVAWFERLESYQGAKVTAQDDPRITPVGKWLRETKLNELPQLPTHAQHLLGRVLPYPQGASRKGRYAVAKAYSVGCAEALW